MFTGLVETVGRVERLVSVAGGARLRVRCPALADELVPGESIAVNGACLTVVAADRDAMTLDVSAETLRRTAFSRLRPGRGVNLERALPAGGRLGGHLVNGHVDTVATVSAIAPQGGFATWRFDVDAVWMRYVVEKGSVAVDGVSLTVSARDVAWFEAALIPATLEQTTFCELRPGDRVNIEVDVLAKYVESLLAPLRERTAPETASSLEETLRRQGYLGS